MRVSKKALLGYDCKKLDGFEHSGMAAISARTPVLIVGGGPVGLALAGDLGWRGVACTLIEKSDGTIVQPKMDLVGVRTMEFCRRWGIVQWVEQSPYPRDYPQDCVYLTGLNGYELGREPFPPTGQEPCPSQSPQKRERCPQDMFDPILRRFACRTPLVDLRYNTELISLEQSEAGVLATVRQAGSGELTIAADYVVGCDGGASTTRELLGIAMSGNPVLTYTTNVIFRTDDLPALHDKGKGYRFIFIGPEGTWLTIVAINGRDRWRMSIVGTPRKVSHDEADIRALIRRAVGRDFAYEILSVVPWVRRELVADNYGRGRVFIAGDAAHMMSPTGGFGMNTGIGDAVDLSWKLAACLAGWGGPGLLASYELERRPVGLRNVAEASNNLSRMLASRQNLPPPAVFEPGPAGEAARREYGQWFTQMMRREWFTLGIQLGYRYDPSPIVWPDHTPAPSDDPNVYVQTARPGSRAPHLWLEPGRSTLDLFGQSLILLCLGSDPPAGEGLRRAAAARGIALARVALPNRAVWEAYERRLVLVRPDGHVAWRDDREPEDPGMVLDVIRGMRAPVGAVVA